MGSILIKKFENEFFNIGGKMIQARVISGYNDAENALLYKPLNNNVLDYLNQHINSALVATKNIATGFANTVTDLYNKFNSDQAILRSKLALNSAGVHLDQNTIHYVRYEQLHAANLAMQRYILAQPELGELHRQDMCYGYQDTFMPLEPGKFGKDTIEYARAMDGVVEFDSDDVAYINTYSIYDTDTHGSDLDIIDQMSILRSWDNVSRMIANKVDPSDPISGEL